MEPRTFFTVLLAVMAASIYQTMEQSTGGKCVTSVDIVIVVDGSNSMGNANFELQKTSIVNLINSLSINETEVRVGLVVFSTEVTDTVPLSGDRNFIINGINDIVYPDEATNTHLGIREAIKLFNTGARGGSTPKLLLLLTDGTATDSDAALAAAEEAKAINATVFAIGVTDEVNVDELNAIASRDDLVKPRVYLTKNFMELNDSLLNATNRACVDLVPPPVPGCDMGLTDLYFVVDLSTKAETLSRDQFTGDFAELKNGLVEQIEIVRDPSVNNSLIRVGLITYSDMARVVVNLTNMGSVNMTAQAFDNLPGAISQGGSNLVLALQQIVNPPVDSDIDSHVAIVAPESAFSTGGALQQELTRLKELGYKIVIFAIQETGTLNVEQLEMEASGSKFFYFLPNYTELEAATKNFTRDQLCGIKRGNSSGLCEGSGHREHGYGVVPHPRDCDKYIQCYYNDIEDLDIGVVRNCPMGLYWHLENKTCVQPHLAMCPHDRCKEDCEAYKMEGACGAYWECENGTSKPMCCQMNFSFVPGVGCQMDFNCKDYCGTEKWCGLCQKKPNWEEPSGYDVMILGGNMWMPRPCYYEDFDIVDCDCTAPRDYACPADRMYDFTDSTTVMDAKEGELGGIRISDVEVTSGGLDLGDKSVVHVKVNPMDSPNEPFTLLVRYKEEETFSPYGEVLFSSGLSCGNGNSLLVTADDSFIHAEVRSANGRSEVKVPTKGLNPESFKDLVVSLADGMLALSIKDEMTQYIAQTKAPGSVCFSCGIDFGAGFNKLSFEGELQKVAVYSCAWPLLY